jgi:hypothetical protein
MRVDLNRLILIVAVLILAGMAGALNYRLEISRNGLMFENNIATAQVH